MNSKLLVLGIIVLAVAVVGEAGYIFVLRQRVESLRNTTSLIQKTANPGPQAGPNARGGRQMLVGKGTNLKESPIFQYAYEIAPVASDSAKKVMTGFSLTSKTLPDGSMLVTLTPKDSEDQDQQYTIKPGQMLYFIEQTPVDDQSGQDKDLNYRDDYGIIVDPNGIVQ